GAPVRGGGGGGDGLVRRGPGGGGGGGPGGPPHAALTTASAELTLANGITLGASFEGEFSDVTRSYAGKGVVRYVW
ncbi:hypothetical protein, partial [Rhodopseudomonas sp. BAL398]|uniref:hypothetical protein n=1 Tax=Rhodopseudomonas sp. BAL398 TaxID=3034676 RepID=UPI0023E20D4C